MLFRSLVDSLRAKGLDPPVVPAPTDRETVAAVAAGGAFGLTADPSLHAPGVDRVALGGEEFHLRVRLVWRAPAPDSCRAIEDVLTGDLHAVR